MEKQKEAFDISCISSLAKNNSLSIIVRPNAGQNEIIGWDTARNALRVNIAAPPENNKANIEVIKFFSKLLKKKIVIMQGMKSKEKTLKLIEK